MGQSALDRAQDFRWEAILSRMNTYYDDALAEAHA